MDDLPIPPFYIAVVAILFLRWIISRAKKAAQRRAEMRNQRNRGFQSTPPSPGPAQSAASTQTSRPAQPQRPTEPHRPAEPPSPSQTVPETLQELFEMRRQAIAEAQRAESKPPPIPIKEEVKEKIPEVKPLVMVPSKPIQGKSDRRGRKTSGIVRSFSDRNQIRKAVILKEVLDKPKGFEL